MFVLLKQMAAATLYMDEIDPESGDAMDAILSNAIAQLDHQGRSSSPTVSGIGGGIGGGGGSGGSGSNTTTGGGNGDDEDGSTDMQVRGG